jgi:low affinity Fe/Cu permease
VTASRRGAKHRDIAAQDLPKRHWTTFAGQAAGHPAAFLVVIVYGLLWLIFERATFDWNAVATLGVFMMTLFIQRANRRDNLALHAKWMNFYASTATHALS